jgi:hypothetical protein
MNVQACFVLFQCIASFSQSPIHTAVNGTSRPGSNKARIPAGRQQIVVFYWFQDSKSLYPLDAINIGTQTG